MQSTGKKQKRYTFRQAMKSVTGRLALVIITLVVPINIISLLLLANNFFNTRQRAEREVTNSLELVASNMLNEIGTMKKTMLYESFDNEYFMTLIDKKITNQNKRYEALNEVLTSLKKIQMTQNQFQMVFFYFPTNDVFAVSGTAGMVFDEMSSKLRNYVIDDPGQMADWSIEVINDIPLIINIENQRDFSYGLILQMNLTASRIKLDKDSKEREVFLGNEEGTIISSDGTAFLNSIDMDIKGVENSRKYFMSKVPVGGTGLYVCEVVSYKEIDAAEGLATRIIMTILGVFIIVAIPVLVIQMRRLIIEPLEELTDAMDIIESGDADHRIEKNAIGLEFQHINSSFNSMLDQLEELKIDVYEHEIEERNIRLEYLSQQVQPHFILNALNILYSYEPEEYELSQKMIMCISKYFRHIVYANDKFVSLKSEMEHIINYFEIQKARFPDLFFSIVEYDEAIAGALVPPLILQTFAENAIKNSLKIGNRITIFIIGDRIEQEGEDFIRVRIADTGEGIPDEILAEINAFKETGIRQEHLGVGIQNSIERFKVIYSDGAKIFFSRDENYPGTNVELILPLHFRGEIPAVEEFI